MGNLRYPPALCASSIVGEHVLNLSVIQCATCHLYIPPRQIDSAPAPVPSVSEAEEDMLDYAIGRRDESRLGCQIPVTKDLVHWLQGGGQLKLPRF